MLANRGKVERGPFLLHVEQGIWVAHWRRANRLAGCGRVLSQPLFLIGDVSNDTAIMT